MKWLVVTPTLGMSEFIEESVRSVAHLPGSVEHIIVTADSTRTSALKGLGSVRIIAETVGQGMYAAINLGIQSATTDWDAFCYLNDDDYFLPAAAFLSTSELKGSDAIFYGKTAMVNAAGEDLYTAPYSPAGSLVPGLLRAGIAPFIQVSSIFPRRVIEKIGLFDASFRYSGDFDHLARAVTKRVRFQLVNRTIAAFRMHAGQLTQNRLAMDLEQDRAMRQLFPSQPKQCKSFGSHFLKVGFRIFNLRSYCARAIRLRALSSVDAFRRA